MFTLDGVLKQHGHTEGRTAALVHLFGPGSFVITQGLIHISTSVMFLPVWVLPESIRVTEL